MRAVLSGILAAILLGCVSTPLPPDVPPSGHLRTAGADFMVNNGRAYYAMTYRVITPFPDSYELRFYFDNPRRGGDPISDTTFVKLDGDLLLVQSIALDCIRNKKRYTVRAEVHRSGSQSGILSAHYQDVEFRVPKDLFAQLGLTNC